MKTSKQVIGRYDRRVTFQYAETIPDGAGGSTATWVDDLAMWAEVRPQTQSETLQNGQIKVQQQYLVTIRYNPNFTRPLDSGYRLKFTAEGQTLYANVHSVQVPMFNNDYTEIIAWRI